MNGVLNTTKRPAEVDEAIVHYLTGTPVCPGTDHAEDCPGCAIEAYLDGIEGQLEATQAALRELHEEMYTVRDGDGPEYVSTAGLNYLRDWFKRTRHLLVSARSGVAGSNPASGLANRSSSGGGSPQGRATGGNQSDHRGRR